MGLAVQTGRPILALCVLLRGLDFIDMGNWKHTEDFKWRSIVIRFSTTGTWNIRISSSEENEVLSETTKGTI